MKYLQNKPNIQILKLPPFTMNYIGEFITLNVEVPVMIFIIFLINSLQLKFNILTNDWIAPAAV